MKEQEEAQGESDSNKRNRQRQVLVTSVSSSKAVQPPPPTVVKEGDIFRTAVKLTQIKLTEHSIIAFPLLSNPVDTVCCVNHTEF